MSSVVADAEAALAMHVSVLAPLSINPAIGTRVTAVTAQDMYIKRRESWRFALSLRSNENTIAVVSYARMDPANLGNTPDEELLRSRLRKMIVKNIGIICYGLPRTATASACGFASSTVYTTPLVKTTSAAFSGATPPPQAVASVKAIEKCGMDH
jgi:predicted Zn-dependent protease